MKNIQILLFVLVSGFTFSQMSVKNITLREDASKQLIYRGYDNNLIFSVLPGDSIIQVISNSDTLVNNHKIFQLIPKEGDEVARISITTKDSLTQEFQLDIASLPKATLHLGSNFGGDLKRADLTSNPGLFLEFGEDHQLPFIFPLKSTLSITNLKGKVKQMNINGNAFSEKQIKQLSKLPVGTRLTFSNVFSSCDFCLDNEIDAQVSYLIVE